MNEIKKVRISVYDILILLCGIIGLWLFLSHMLHFSYLDYFYAENEGIEIYIGTNVVSMWADFSFFTYHTLIFFSIWCILFGLSKIFKFNKLHTFLRKDTILSFVFTNYIITTLLYTCFELSSGNITFGLYAYNAFAFHNLGTNILIHYIYFIFALIIFLKVKSVRSESKFCYVYIISYLVLYYVIVKVLGEFAYSITWFPYIIFDASSFGSMFGISNYFLSVLALIFSLIIIGLIYVSIYHYNIKYKRKSGISI